MKTNKLQIVLMTVVTALSVHAPLAYAAGYILDWQTVDGGGNCSGGKFSVSGATGQPDAGFCTGSTYAHQGGFVPGFQKDVGPRLSMTRSMGSLTFTWPGTCAGFVLEGAQNVNGPWTDLGTGMLSGGAYQLILSNPAPNRFFRLRKDCPK
jgi:hypothetical protein